MNVTNEDITKTYVKLFKYVDTIVYKYYNNQNNRNAFKSISHDYKDLKQEAYIIVLKHLEEYETKYKGTKLYGRQRKDGSRGIHLAHHIKKMVLYRLKNILRDNLNQGFVGLEEILSDGELTEQIRSNKVDKELAHLAETISLQKLGIKVGKEIKNEDEAELERENIRARFVKLFNPLMISSKTKEPLLNDEEIEKILRRDCKTEDEFKVMKLRIIYNYSFKEIFITLKLPNRQNVYDKFQRVVGRLKRRFKTMDELIE